MASPDELDAASVASPHASPEHRDGAREATEPCVVCGGPTVLCCSGGRVGERGGVVLEVLGARVKVDLC